MQVQNLLDDCVIHQFKNKNKKETNKKTRNLFTHQLAKSAHDSFLLTITQGFHCFKKKKKKKMQSTQEESHIGIPSLQNKIECSEAVITI